MIRKNSILLHVVIFKCNEFAKMQLCTLKCCHFFHSVSASNELQPKVNDRKYAPNGWCVCRDARTVSSIVCIIQFALEIMAPNNIQQLVGKLMTQLDWKSITKMTVYFACRFLPFACVIHHCQKEKRTNANTVSVSAHLNDFHCDYCFSHYSTITMLLPTRKRNATRISGIFYSNFICYSVN